MGGLGGPSNITRLEGYLTGIKGVEWIYNVQKADTSGTSRNYMQNLTAQTTTSTTPVSIGSTNVIAQISGRVKIDVVVRGNNNTLSDGITVSLYAGASSGALTTLIDSETYTQEGAASNSHTFVIHYEQTGIAVGGVSEYYSIAINSITGGTASAKIIAFILEEVM